MTLPPDTSYVAVVDNEGNVFSATPSDGFSVPIIPGLGFVVSPRGSQSSLNRRRRPRCQTGQAPASDDEPVHPVQGSEAGDAVGPGADVQPQAMLQFVLNVTEFGMNRRRRRRRRALDVQFPADLGPAPVQPEPAEGGGADGPGGVEGLAAKGHDVVAWQAAPGGGISLRIWIDREKGTLTAEQAPRVASRWAGRNPYPNPLSRTRERGERGRAARARGR